MEEARRFFRYVIPGLLFFIEISLYLFFSACTQFSQFLREYGKDLSFPVTVFLASGGVGFLFGVIYSIGFREFGGVNYKPLIQDCVERGWLKLVLRKDGTNLSSSEVTQSVAWRIVTSYWHERRESSEKIKAANARTDSLTDIMHGLGATIVGSICAFGFWIYIHTVLAGSCPSWYCFIIPLVLSCLLGLNYYRVVKDCQSVVSIIMSDDIKSESEKNKAPVVVNLDSID
jgi:hypothetical protein